jgi:hypothetical protein
VQEHADQRGEPGRFDRGRHEGRYRRGRAVVDVRRPHVERHGRHFEPEPDEQQSDAEVQHQIALEAETRDL